MSHTKGHINFPEYFISTTHPISKHGNTAVLFCNALLLNKWTIEWIFFWKSSEWETQSLCVCVCFRNRGECSFQLQLRRLQKACQSSIQRVRTGTYTVGGIWLQDTGGHRSNNYTLNFCPSHTFLMFNSHRLPSRPPTQPNHDISGDFGCSTFFGITVLACNDMTYAQKLNKHISLNNSHYYNAYDHFLNSHYSRWRCSLCNIFFYIKS